MVDRGEVDECGAKRRGELAPAAAHPAFRDEQRETRLQISPPSRPSPAPLLFFLPTFPPPPPATTDRRASRRRSVSSSLFFSFRISFVESCLSLPVCDPHFHQHHGFANMYSDPRRSIHTSSSAARSSSSHATAPSASSRPASRPHPQRIPSTRRPSYSLAKVSVSRPLPLAQGCATVLELLVQAKATAEVSRHRRRTRKARRRTQTRRLCVFRVQLERVGGVWLRWTSLPRTPTA